MIEGENIPFKDQAINTNIKHTNKVFELGPIYYKDFLEIQIELCLLSLFLRGIRDGNTE